MRALVIKPGDSDSYNLFQSQAQFLQINPLPQNNLDVCTKASSLVDVILRSRICINTVWSLSS